MSKILGNSQSPPVLNAANQAVPLSARRRTVLARLGLLSLSLVGVPATSLIIGCGGSEKAAITAENSGYDMGDKPADKDSAAAPAAAEPAANPAAAAAPSIPTDVQGGPAPFEMQSPLQGNPQVATEARSFMSLKMTDATEPAALITFFGQTDQAIRDMAMVAQQGMVDEATFKARGKVLSDLKLQAAQRLLASPSLTPDQKKAGQSALLESLSQLSGLGDVDSSDTLKQLANELAASDDKELAHEAKMVLFGFNLMQLENGEIKEPQPVVDSMSALLDDPSMRKEPEMMMMMQGLTVLQRMGFDDAFNTVKNKVAAAFIDSDNPRLASTAWQLQVNGSPQVEALQTALDGVLSGKSEDVAPVTAAVDGLIKEFPGVQTISFIASQIVNIEYSGKVDVARALVDGIKPSLDSITDAEAKEQVKGILDSFEKRVSIIGQPMTFEGLVSMEGQPFSASDYAGKVVLVDFWATWCGPCLAEIPNMRQAYTDFHDKGFEIISINLDDTADKVVQYLTTSPAPWATYRSADASQAGFNTPLAKQLGIEAIPFMVVLDRQGNVAALHARGSTLSETIEKLLAQ